MSSYRPSLSLLHGPIATRACLSLAVLATVITAPTAVFAADEDISEIVVTVRQRAESLKDVPGTVSAFSAETLEAAGVQRARDFIALTPGVSIVNAAEVADSQVNIRGMNGARDAETNYALIIDGILMTNPAALNREYTNLEQVAILKGPQGAIYGRNASAGAIVITTEKPGEEFAGDVKASFAQDDSYLLTGSVGGPATDTLKWSISADYRDSNGYYSNKNTGDTYSRNAYPDPGCDDCVDYFEGWNVGGRLIWEPSDDLSVDSKLRYGKVDAGAITFNSVFHLPGLTGFGAAFAEDVNSHDFGFYPNIKPFNNQETTEFSVKVDYDVGFGDLTAWGLYSDIENSFGADGTSGAFGFFNTDQRCIDTSAARVDANDPDDIGLAGFPLNAPQYIGGAPGFPNSVLGAYTSTSCDGTQYQERNQTDYSFEVRLASKSEQRLRWLAGLYYLNIDREVGVNTGLDTGAGIVENLYVTDARNPTQQLVDDDFGTDVYAVFGQLAYDLTDAIELSFALRYDREERDAHSKVPTDATTDFIDTCLDGPGSDPINPGLCATGSIADQSKTFDQWEPKLAMTWDFTEALTAFASIGVGFKSGGFNNSGSQATIDGFINDAIVVGSTPGATGCDDVVANGGFSCVNIQDNYDEETSTSYEIGLKSQFMDNRMRAEVAYYHTDVDDMQFFEFFVGPFGLLRVVSNIDKVSIDGIEGGINWVATDWLELFAGAAWIDTNIDENNARPDTVGNDSPYTPKWTGSAGGRFTVPITAGLDFIANVDVNAIGETWFHAVQDQQRPTGFGPGDYSLAERDAYTLVNARVGVQGDNWTAVVFGTNIFDEDHLEEVIPAPEFGGSFIHAGTESRFGVEATYKF